MENIFIAVDFTEASKNAVNYAANLAGFFGAKLMLFHAYHSPITNFETGYIPPVSDMEEESDIVMKKMLAELSEKYKGVEISYDIEMGLAGDIVEETAIKNNADLIIMGIAGQNSVIKEHLVGSVATQIAQDSKIPVLIIPEHCKYTKIKKMAFACDFDKKLETNNTLLKVKYFTSLFGAELDILNVMDPSEEISVEKAETDMYLEKKLENTNHKTFFVYEKDVNKGILEFIDVNNCDLIVTSPKKHNFFYNLFVESHTKKLVFHSPVPVLTIHE